MAFDFSRYVAPRPDGSGSRAILDAFDALAKRRAEIEDRDRREAFLRWQEDQQGIRAQATLDEQTRHNMAGEEHQRGTLAETERAHRANEENAAADNERQMADFRAKLLGDQKFLDAIQGQDPAALEAYAPAIAQAGFTLESARDYIERNRPAALPEGMIPVDEDRIDETSAMLDTYEQPQTPEGARVVLDSSGKQVLGFDPYANAQRALARAKQAGDALEGAASGLGENDATGIKAGAATLRSLIGMGIDPTKAAPLAMNFGGGAAQRGQSADNAALVAANREKTGERQDDGLDLKKGNYARSLAKDVLAQFGFKEIQAQNRKFNDMATRLSGKPNPATDAIIAGEFVKMAQGGVGVISDGDMRVFWEAIGGLEVKTWGQVQKILDGTIEPEKRAAVLAAVKDLARAARRNLTNVQDRLRDAMETDPNVTPAMRASIYKTYQVTPPKPPAAPGGGKSAGNSEQAAQGLIGKYK